MCLCGIIISSNIFFAKNNIYFVSYFECDDYSRNRFHDVLFRSKFVYYHGY